MDTQQNAYHVRCTASPVFLARKAPSVYHQLIASQVARGPRVSNSPNRTKSSLRIDLLASSLCKALHHSVCYRCGL